MKYEDLKALISVLLCASFFKLFCCHFVPKPFDDYQSMKNLENKPFVDYKVCPCYYIWMRGEGSCDHQYISKNPPATSDQLNSTCYIHMQTWYIASLYKDHYCSTNAYSQHTTCCLQFQGLLCNLQPY